MMLEIKDLVVKIVDSEKVILDGVSLSIKPGERVALMGPNGSGKSTLVHAVMGHPKYEIVSGSILVDGVDVTEMEPDERARAGLFVSFQYPAAVPGVRLRDFLRAAYNSVHEEKLSVPKFRRLLKEHMDVLKMDESFVDRYVNDGWSGGEKKRGEILQLRLLGPKVALLDETDSGLDIDAIRIVSEGVLNAQKENESMGTLVITHYQRILNYLSPDRVIILANGKIVEEGDASLVEKLESEGYDWLVS